MQIPNRIDQTTLTDNAAKPFITANKITHDTGFSEKLTESLKSLSTTSVISQKKISIDQHKSAAIIPHWVDPNYIYDPENPRKPNMRELMEAISGKSIEEINDDTDEAQRNISSISSEMLYGVIGSNTDIRNWSEIMSAEDTLVAARKATGKMYSPTVDIDTRVNDNGEIENQIAVLKDKNGNLLRALPTNLIVANETLENFGATQDSVPKNLENKIIKGKFNNELLGFLKNFGQPPTQINRLALQETSKAIAERLSVEPTLSEYEKL